MSYTAQKSENRYIRWEPQKRAKSSLYYGKRMNFIKERPRLLFNLIIHNKRDQYPIPFPGVFPYTMIMIGIFYAEES